MVVSPRGLFWYGMARASGLSQKQLAKLLVYSWFGEAMLGVVQFSLLSWVCFVIVSLIWPLGALWELNRMFTRVRFDPSAPPKKPGMIQLPCKLHKRSGFHHGFISWRERISMSTIHSMSHTPYGYGSKSNHQGTGFGPCFHRAAHLGYLFF